jgi:hypothetical protein
MILSSQVRQVSKNLIRPSVRLFGTKTFFKTMPVEQPIMNNEEIQVMRKSLESDCMHYAHHKHLMNSHIHEKFHYANGKTSTLEFDKETKQLVAFTKDGYSLYHPYYHGAIGALACGYGFSKAGLVASVFGVVSVLGLGPYTGSLLFAILVC